jgi:hypothetical protein
MQAGFHTNPRSLAHDTLDFIQQVVSTLRHLACGLILKVGPEFCGGFLIPA